MLNIVVVGGGNLGHAFIGYLGQQKDVNLTILTRSPEKWSKNIDVFNDNNFLYTSTNYSICDNYNCLTKADVIIITLPTNVKCEYLLNVKKYITEKSIILTAPSIGGMNFIFDKHFPNNKYICMQRVPFICRIIKYGSSVNIDIKKSVEIYYSNNISHENKQLIESILNIPVKQLNSYWSLSLSNSNPIIHIARLCEIMDSVDFGSYNPLFYENWGNDASKLALDMDAELGLIMEKLKCEDYHSLLKHYEVKDVNTLTQKINSIQSFKGILSPMILKNKKYIFDINSRYFIEDLIFGTCFIKFIAQKLNIPTPNINYAIEKIQTVLGSVFVNKNDNKLNIDEWLKYTKINYDKLIKFN